MTTSEPSSYKPIESSIPSHSSSEMLPNEKSTSFWSTTAYDENYWQTYLAVRPKYSPAFYEQVFSYYRSHQTTSSTAAIAHDLGTGPGQVALTLARSGLFKTVIASDPNLAHLNYAAVQVRKNLEIGGNKHHNHLDSHTAATIDLIKCPAEKIADRFPAHSANLITAAECIPLLSYDPFLSACSTLLAPNGTLAIWFYGRPNFVPSPAYNATVCNEIYARIATAAWRPIYHAAVVQGPHTPAYQGVYRAHRAMDSYLDDVPFDPALWRDVQRHKFNPHLPLNMSDSADVMSIPLPAASKTQDLEETRIITDDTFWAESWTVRDWKDFSIANLPAGALRVTDEMATWWAELEVAMGGEHARRNVTWSCVLLLATRR